jgi:hypothetical protein
LLLGYRVVVLTSLSKYVIALPMGEGEMRSINGNERLEFTKSLVADSANHHQMLCAAKGAKTSSVVNDARRYRASNSWQDFQFNSRCGVDVYERTVVRRASLFRRRRSLRERGTSSGEETEAARQKND